MFKKLCILSLLISFVSYAQELAHTSIKYQWAIIGAGPAGITALAVLLESCIDPCTIIWIDPEFNVGRMGKYYRNVPSNTKVKQLMGYINSCGVFKKFVSSSRDALFASDPEEFYPLHTIVDPLIDATRYIQSQIISLQDMVGAVNKHGDEWVLECTTTHIRAHKVILAIGSHPKKLDYQLPVIPSDEAVDKDKLALYVDSNDCIAVFGGMHSAMLILKYLSELGVKHIINFYTTPYFCRIPGAESLEGITEFWVKNILEKNPPANLLRMENTPENVDKFLPMCNKVMYAIGYEKNPLCINGRYDWEFDEKTGIIEPNLYGIGIAFAHTITLRNKKKVAINGFGIYISHAHSLIPKWKNEL